MRKQFHELFSDQKIIELLTDPEEPGMFYRHLLYSFIHSLTHPFLPNLQNIITPITRTRTTIRAIELEFWEKVHTLSSMRCSALNCCAMTQYILLILDSLKSSEFPAWQKLQCNSINKSFYQGSADSELNSTAPLMTKSQSLSVFLDGVHLQPKGAKVWFCIPSLSYLLPHIFLYWICFDINTRFTESCSAVQCTAV